MRLIARRMRGMQDILPEESEKWEFLEKIMKQQADLYGFRMIRTPVIEATGLFKRENSGASDMVDKEMYTFSDKGGRNVSLRPEGTAGIIRAVMENGLHNQGLPLKLMYLSSCYRYEKPQVGRLREFFQFGLEIIGGNATMADAEIICLADSIFKKLGLEDIIIMINAVGCEGCQPRYIRDVTQYFTKNKDMLCETCKSRLERSPLRIFDCKNLTCMKVSRGAPTSIEYLCADCAEHLHKLKLYTHECGVRVRVHPCLFRGLDYYTRSAFEFWDCSNSEGLVICGGGRYDNLSKEIGGGQRMMSVGLGIGMERLIYVMERHGIKFPEHRPCDIYIAPLGSPARLEAVKMADELRKSGIRAEMDLVGRFIKPQMRYADKIKAKYTVVIGANEIESKTAVIKNMQTGQTTNINLGDRFLHEFIDICRKDEGTYSPGSPTLDV